MPLCDRYEMRDITYYELDIIIWQRITSLHSPLKSCSCEYWLVNTDKVRTTFNLGKIKSLIDWDKSDSNQIVCQIIWHYLSECEGWSVVSPPATTLMVTM